MWSTCLHKIINVIIILDRTITGIDFIIPWFWFQNLCVPWFQFLNIYLFPGSNSQTFIYSLVPILNLPLVRFLNLHLFPSLNSRTCISPWFRFLEYSYFRFLNLYLFPSSNSRNFMCSFVLIPKPLFFP